MLSHWGFILHFPDEYTILHGPLFPVLNGHLDSSCTEYLSKCFVHLKKMGCLGFPYGYSNAVYILCSLSSVYCKYLSIDCQLSQKCCLPRILSC